MRVRHALIAVALILAVLVGYVWAYAENRLWNESRQFEQHIEKAAPEVTRFIWATHISDQGLEVQLAMGAVHRTLLDEQGFYKTITELWKSSEFVKKRKYSGKVKFMQLDRTVKTIE